MPLKKAGTTFKGLCPFHGEKTPSFVVTPARETWKCFGCGQGGDIFNFVMERDGIDFPEALRRLAGAGRRRARRADDARGRPAQAPARRARGGHRLLPPVLTDIHSGQPALDYLHGRGFTDATIDTFQLGFAPDAWDSADHRPDDEAPDATKRTSRRPAWSSSRQRSGGVYDRFRAASSSPSATRRATPRASAAGSSRRTSGAEATDRDQGPKYLNTPATPLFDKSRTLYLIDRAKGAIRKQGRAVLVEGNTDALMAHQQGFENVVGSLGTALTAGQVELVTRYAPRIALAYDVDAAGQGAAHVRRHRADRARRRDRAQPHRGRLTDVGVVRLPEGKDPDEVIRDDPETWRSRTEQPQPIMEYLIDTSPHASTPSRSRAASASWRPSCPPCAASPTRSAATATSSSSRAARGVDEHVLLEALRQPQGVGPGRPNVAGSGSGIGSPDGAHAGGRINLDAVLASPARSIPEAVERTLEPVESALLRLLLVHPGASCRVRDRLPARPWSRPRPASCWRAILADRDADPTGSTGPRSWPRWSRRSRPSRARSTPAPTPCPTPRRRSIRRSTRAC